VNEHAIGIAPRLPKRPPAWPIAYEHLGAALIALDLVVLLSAALLGHELHSRIRHGLAGDPMRFTSVAAIPTALLLPLLSAKGAYHPDRIVDPHGSARLVLPVCLAAFGFLWVILCGLGIEAEVDAVGLMIFGAAAPAVLLLQRRLVANLARSAMDTGHLRLRRTYTIVEAPTREGIGFDRPDAVTVTSLTELDPGSLERLLASIRAFDAEEIHLVCPRRSLSECQAFLSQLRRVPLTVKLIADAGQAELMGCRLVRARGAFAFEVQRAPLSAVDRALKRSVDISVSLALCVLLAPLFAAVAVLIRLTSEGPVLFRQTRNGLHGRPFNIYKFRTMVVQEDGPRVVQARPNDPRVTALGALMRRTSIDELPQLINVLKGEMSLIGPRPHAMAHDDDFAGRVADYALRYHVKPGMTGLAQVEGLRGGTTTSEAIRRRVEFDLRYIERWSFWLDLWIMIRTMPALAFPRNAY
jgi:Undecaprenyl-phosphate glucose phosphotransferase